MRALRHRVGSGRRSAVVALLLASSLSREASAQPRPVVLQAEVGVASPLPDLDDLGHCEALRVHAPFAGSFGPRFGASRCAFAEQLTAAAAIYTVSGGISWRPSLHRRVRLALEAEAGLGVSSGAGHALLGGSLGVDVSLVDGLTIGPALRYQHLLAGSASVDDLRWATFSVVVGFSSELLSRAPAAPRAPVVAPRAPVVAPRAPVVAPPTPAAPRVSPTPVPVAPRALPPAPSTPRPPTPPPSPPATAADSDHDGVPDSRDVCPTEAASWLPDPSRLGCSLPDRDHDLVPDASDVCPDVAGAPHLEAPLHGCPGGLRVDGRRLRFDEPLVFDIVRLRRASFPALRELRSVLQALPPSVRITLVGHAAAEPDPVGRLQLAADRALALRSWLLAHDLRREHLETAEAPPPGVTAAPDPATQESVDVWLSAPSTTTSR